MSRGLLFWILVILWVIFGIGGYIIGPEYRLYAAGGGHLLVLILFVLLGWQVFGPPVKG